MKTHPSQRKFGLPVAIVASAHAILFLGFRVPQTTHVTHPAPQEDRTICLTPPIEDPVVVDTTEMNRTETQQTPRGSPTPQSDDRPTLTPDPIAITVPVEPHAFHSSASPVSLIPAIAGIPDGTPSLATITELDFVPRALSRVSPIYPTSMKSAGISGTVTIMFTVDESGRVVETAVMNATRSEFEEAAVRAVSHWRFEPGKRHGRPTAFRMSVPLNFVLDN